MSKTITVREIENAPGFHVEPAPLTVRETGSATYAVNLGAFFQTGLQVTVTLAATGDGDVTFDTDPNTSGNQNRLTFTNNNRHVPQTVTVSAASDNDAANGTATITHTTNSLDSDYSNVTATLTVTEADTDIVSLTTGSVTATGVTLTIANHTAAWWYKSDTAGATTCTPVAQNTSTATVTGLTPATAYTYTAYSGNACSTSLVVATAAAFTTNGFSVSNLGESDHTSDCSMSGGAECAVAFTTGTAANGYTLHSITAKFKLVDSPTGFVATLHSDNNGKPTANALATLGGSALTSTTGAEYTYTCAGSGCALSGNATYHVQFDQSAGPTSHTFVLFATTSDDETRIPSGNGWALANEINHGIDNNWDSNPYDYAGKVKIVATAGSGGGPNQQQPAQEPEPEPEPSSQPPAQFTPTLTAGDGKLTASWTPPADNGDAITGYRVQYRQHPGGAWAVSGGVLNADARRLEIAGLENGATYRVRAQAQNGAGWGRHSWPLAEITLPAPQPPASVASVSASRSNGAIAVSWDAAAGATKYHVTYTGDGGASWSLAALEHSATSITISGADSGKSYIVGVRAGNAAGWSGWVNSPPAKYDAGASTQ